VHKILSHIIFMVILAVHISNVEAQTPAAAEALAVQQSGAAATVLAAEQNTLSPAKPVGPVKSLPLRSLKPAPNSRGQLLQVMLALAGVLALIFALAWLFKRFVQPMSLSGQQIKVVSSLALGNKEKLVLAEVNGQQILLGVTAQNINSLQTYAAGEPETKNADFPSRDETVTDFKSKLKHVLQNSQS